MNETRMTVPMSSPDLTDAEIQTVLQVLDTRYLSIGPKLQAFEAAFAAYIGVPHAAGVNSGTSGLHLCIIAANVGVGDLVITTPFSFIASANCILYERALPVFVDVEPTTGNIDPALVVQATEELVNGHPDAHRWLPPAVRDSYGAVDGSRVKAILPVHSFGQPADMDPILEVARKYNLAVIEDACESPGSHYKGKGTGLLGDAAVYAFYPNKQMTTGEGGMITTPHKEWDDLFRSLRNQGRDVFNTWLNHSRLGYNYRMDELSAALGLVQTQRLEEMIERRAQVAAWYNARLADNPFIELPYVAPTTTRMSWFVYVVRVLPPVQRNDLLARLSEVGVPSRPYFTPIHLQSFYMEQYGFRRGDFPVTEHLGDVSLALPFSSVMTEAQVDYVCEQLAHLTRTMTEEVQTL